MDRWADKDLVDKLTVVLLFSLAAPIIVGGIGATIGLFWFGGRVVGLW